MKITVKVLANNSIIITVIDTGETITLTPAEPLLAFGLQFKWRKGQLYLVAVDSIADIHLELDDAICLYKINLLNPNFKVVAPRVKLQQVEISNIEILTKKLEFINANIIQNLKVIAYIVRSQPSARLKVTVANIDARDKVILPLWLQAQNIRVVAPNVYGFNLDAKSLVVKANTAEFYKNLKVDVAKMLAANITLHPHLSLFKQLELIATEIYLKGEITITKLALIVANEMHLLHDCALQCQQAIKLDVVNAYLSGKLIVLGVAEIYVAHNFYYYASKLIVENLKMKVKNLTWLHNITHVQSLNVDLRTSAICTLSNVNISAKFKLQAPYAKIQILDTVTIDDFSIQASQVALVAAALQGLCLNIVAAVVAVDAASKIHSQQISIRADNILYNGQLATTNARLKASSAINFNQGAKVVVFDNLHLLAPTIYVGLVAKNLSSLPSQFIFSLPAKILVLKDLVTTGKLVIRGGKVLVGSNHSYTDSIEVYNVDEYFICKYSADYGVVDQKRVINSEPGVLAVGKELLPEIMQTSSYQAASIINQGIITMQNGFLSATAIRNVTSAIYRKEREFDTFVASKFDKLTFGLGQLKNLFWNSAFDQALRLKARSTSNIKFKPSKRYGLQVLLQVKKTDAATPLLYVTDTLLALANKLELQGQVCIAKELKAKAYKIQVSSNSKVVAATGDKTEVSAAVAKLYATEYQQIAADLKVKQDLLVSADKTLITASSDAQLVTSTIKASSARLAGNQLRFVGSLLQAGTATLDYKSIAVTPGLLRSYSKEQKLKLGYKAEASFYGYDLALSKIHALNLKVVAKTLVLQACELVANSLTINADELKARALAVESKVDFKVFELSYKSLGGFKKTLNIKTWAPTVIKAKDFGIKASSIIWYGTQVTVLGKYCCNSKSEHKIDIENTIEGESVGLMLRISSSVFKKLLLKLMAAHLSDAKSRQVATVLNTVTMLFENKINALTAEVAEKIIKAGKTDDSYGLDILFGIEKTRKVELVPVKIA